jgi:hypothetical protein
MSRRIPSRAGETSAFDMAANVMSFAPLSTFTSEAQALQDKYLASIRARIDSGSYPSGLRKQYEVQLEHVEAQLPSCELILVPAYGIVKRKRKRDRLAYSGLLIPTS